jgi:hypothetical protein
MNNRDTERKYDAEYHVVDSVLRWRARNGCKAYSGVLVKTRKFDTASR